jgi:geranylgeranyl reductase family protein
METDFDVIVVGAGPSGTSAAYGLRGLGYRVLLIDKKQSPHDKPCGGGLSIKTLKLLPWSIGPVAERTAATLHMGLHRRAKTRCVAFETDGQVCAFAVRKEFDRFNLAKTIESGVEFHQGEPIGEIESREDCVRVFVDGKIRTARYLIGADGANSAVRQNLGPAIWFHRGFAIEGTIDYRTLGHAPRPEFIFGYVENGYGWLFPKSDHVNVGIYSWDNKVHLSKSLLRDYARERTGTDRIDHVAGFPLGFGGARQIPDHNRILLVGDAAGFTEPLLGEGIHNALKSGQAAASAIAKHDTGGAADLAEAYRIALRPLLKDLARCEQIKRFFYANLSGAGFRTLTMPIVRTALMRGFAAGKTMHELSNRFLLAPWFRPLMPVEDGRR